MGRRLGLGLGVIVPIDRDFGDLDILCNAASCASKDSLWSYLRLGLKWVG